MRGFESASVQGLPDAQCLVLVGSGTVVRIPVELFSASPRIYRLVPKDAVLKHNGRGVERVRVNHAGDVLEFVCSSAVLGELEVESVE